MTPVSLLLRVRTRSERQPVRCAASVGMRVSVDADVVYGQRKQDCPFLTM